MNMCEEVKEFCHQKNTAGALLITGNWGCGKTYFINKEICEDSNIKKEFTIIKISLFGIQTTEQFNATLKKEYIRVRYASSLSQDSQNKIIEGFKGIQKAITQFAPATKFIFSVDWSTFVSIESFDKKKILLIFDDLERCKLDIPVIFGLLNDYIENQHFKTIIIANEETDALIQDKKYLEMKEKIISRTIKMKTDHKKIINNIINEYEETEEGYKQFLLKNLGNIVNAFLDGNESNFRSFKSAIQDFERFYHIISAYISDIKIKSCMLYNFLALVFEYKDNITQGLNDGEPDSDSNHLWDDFIKDYDTKKKYKNYNSAFRSEAMTDWVKKGEWNEQLLVDELKKIVKSLEKEEPKVTLLKSQNVICVDDDILEKGLAPLLEDAYMGDFELNDYISLFTIIISANYFKVSLPCTIDNNRLKQGVEKRKKDIVNGKHEKLRIYISKNDMMYLSPEQKEIVNEIEEIGDQVDYISLRYQIIQALKLGDSKFINENIEKYTGSFDKEYAESIIRYYISLNNGDKHFLISLLKKSWEDSRLYSYENVDKSIEGLDIIKSFIEPPIQDGKIVNALNKILYDEVNKVIKLYKEKKAEFNKIDAINCNTDI